MKIPSRAVLGTILALLTFCICTEAAASIGLRITENVEEGTNLTVCVNFNQPEDTTVTVEINTNFFDGGAVVNVDYRIPDSTLTFNPGDLQQCTMAEMLADDIVESGELFEIFITTSIAVTPGLQSSFITILDRSRILIAFEEEEFTTNEGAPAVEVCAIIVQGTTVRDVTFQISTNTVPPQGSNAATLGVDYFSTTDGRTFSSSITRQCTAVTLNEDTIIEAPEFFEVVLGTTQDAITIQNRTGRVIIEDNDGVTMSVVNTVISVTEGNVGLTPVNICVTLDNVQSGLLRSIPVNLTTLQGSANFEDYEVLVDSQWIIPSTTALGESVCHSVNVIGDNISEQNEFFRVQLEAGNTNDVFTGGSFVRIIILNDGDLILQCPVLTPPPNGDVTIAPTNRIQGAVATYTCNEGFELVGEATRTCDTTAQWTGTASTCQIIDCGTPPSITQATVQFTATTFGAQALYMCTDGYEFNNAQLTFTRQCQLDGLWSGLNNAPSCQVVDCGDPPPVPNSSVEFTTTTFESQANYTCDNGFELNNNESTFARTCEATATWSNNVLDCQPVECGAPPSISNTTTDYNATTFQSEAIYTCEGDNIFSSGELTFVRTCEATEMWSDLDNAPVCEIACPDLEDPNNGSVNVESVAIGFNATYSCDSGFGISGLEVRTCLENGTWSGEEPICEVNCEMLSVDNGNVTFTDARRIGSMATTICNGEFRLVGDMTRTCGEDGEWSGMTAFCNPVQTSTEVEINPEPEPDNTNMVIAIAVGVGGGALLLIVVCSVVVIALLLIRRKKIYRKYVLPYRTYIHSTPKTSVRNKPLRDNDITLFENDSRQHAVDAVEALDKPKQ